MTKKQINKIKKHIYYDPHTGNFTWIKPPSFRVCKGSIAGCLNKQGYIVIRAFGKLYLAHRLAFYFTYGKIINQIDHINRNRQDNRLINLRDVTNKQNSLNSGISKTNTTGVKGVSYYKPYDAYVAYITVDGKRHTLGYGHSIESARQLRINAEIKFYGEEL